MKTIAHSDKVGIVCATVVLAELTLLDVFGSGTLLTTVALLPSGPVAASPTLTTTVIVALAPALRRPRLQTSGLGAPHAPWLGVAEPKVTLADSGWPGATGFGEFTLVRTRSALPTGLPLTVVLVVTVLLDVFGSGTSLATVA